MNRNAVDGLGATALAVGLAAWVGCGGSGPTTAPTPSPTPSLPAPPVTAPTTAPGSFTVSSLQTLGGLNPLADFVERPVTFSWNVVPTADSYLIEVGSSPRTADVLALSAGGTSHSSMIAASGHFYVHILAQNTVGKGPATADIQVDMFSFKDYVEALFLGTGPLAESPQIGCLAGTGRMAGWPSGTNVTVILASSLNARQQSQATTAANLASLATSGVVSTTVTTSPDPHPTPRAFELVAQQLDPLPCRSVGAGGCAENRFSSPGVILNGSIYALATGSPMAHETGHALYGFCHFSMGAGAFGASVMGFLNGDGVTGLSEADLAASQAVYQAGLRGGATRSNFVAAGLIKP